MAKKLTAQQWLEIETRLATGEATAYALAKEYGVVEGTIRARFKNKSAKRFDDAVSKVIEAKMAVRELPPILQVKADVIADQKIDAMDRMTQTTSKLLNVAGKLAEIADIQTDLVDPNYPDKEQLKLIHGILETSNKAAYQPLELMKAMRGREEPEEQKPTTIDPAALSPETRRELLRIRGDATTD
jgi:hypothetical protein